MKFFCEKLKYLRMKGCEVWKLFSNYIYMHIYRHTTIYIYVNFVSIRFLYMWRECQNVNKVENTIRFYCTYLVQGDSCHEYTYYYCRLFYLNLKILYSTYRSSVFGEHPTMCYFETKSSSTIPYPSKIEVI